MAKLIFISTGILWDSRRNSPHTGIVSALSDINSSGCGIFLVSNRDKPRWLEKEFPFIIFQQCNYPFHRQNGKIVYEIIKANEHQNLRHSDIVVLGTSEEDFLMAVNSQTLLFCGLWGNPVDDKIKKYGLAISAPSEIPIIVRLLEDQIPWFFQYQSDSLGIYALSNAGTKIERDRDIIRLVERLRACLKSGDTGLSRYFKIHLLSSLSSTEEFRDVDYWGFYPASDSTNKEEETIASYCELARISFKKRTYGPLFIRHQPAEKRHISGGLRTDPSSQIETIHINPKYKDRIYGKVVCVLDDYFTYGVSFGVSHALLKKAGASRVICVAMGKFGNCANLYDIDIQTDNVFEPITLYRCGSYTPISGTIVNQAQLEFLKKFKEYL